MARDTQDRTGRDTRLWPFLVLTFAITWGVGGAWLLFPKPLTAAFGPFAYGTVPFYVSAWGPTLAALILAARQGRIGDLLRSLARPFPPWTLAAAFLVLPAIALALSLVLPRLEPWPVAPRQVLVDTPLILFTTAQILTNSGPLGEELGWRGWALPGCWRAPRPWRRPRSWARSGPSGTCRPSCSRASSARPCRTCPGTPWARSACPG